VNYLLDTNAVSEWVKPRPNPGLIRWMESADEDRLYLSVITLAELHYGVERMPAGSRRERLHRWLALELPERFQGRVLGIDEGVAVAWGKVVSTSESAGRPIGTMDAFLVAIAQVRACTLVTRNAAHFAMITVLNPWI